MQIQAKLPKLNSACNPKLYGHNFLRRTKICFSLAWYFIGYLLGINVFILNAFMQIVGEREMKMRALAKSC